MAKKKTAENSEPKVVTKCDNLNAVSPAHDKVVTTVANSHCGLIKRYLVC